MNNDLISREALRKAFHERIWYFTKSSWDEANALIDSAPTVKPCENCDLYFKAMTKEEMKAYMQQSCYTCKHKAGCPKSAVCQGCRGFNHYEKGGVV